MLNKFVDLNQINLLIVGVAIMTSVMLGVVVFLNDRKSTTNRAFVLFSVFSVFWNMCNYLFYQPNHSPLVALWLLRFVVFFAVWYCFSLFNFFYVFPEKNFSFSKKYLDLLVPGVVLVSGVTLTDLVFKQINNFSPDGRVDSVQNGFGIYIFGVTIISLIISSFLVLREKIKKTTPGTPSRENLFYILIGSIITFTLHLIFNMALPAFFNISQFTALGAVFTLPFIIFTAFAIIKYGLFSLKIATTELIVFALWIFLLIRTLISSSVQDIIINGGLFLTMLVVGFFLIKSVMREVEQKEYLQALNTELKALIQQRESLVHLITHKVKGSFTRSKYLFSEMLDGTFGDLSPVLAGMVKRGLDSDIEGISTVDLVLNSANLQNGTVKYDMKPMDFKEIVTKLFAEKKVSAEGKGLKMELNVADGDYNMLGDVFWIREVVINLFENSIRYTKQGSINVALARKDKKILLSVVDTGVGITEEDKKNLFKEGGRGKDSVKINVDSTGYGLFSVKLIVDAHKGRIWGESLGQDKGSSFYAEFDAIK